MVTPARRILDLPPYMFAELDRKVAAKRAEGVDLISLGVGDPDLPTPRHVVEALQEAAEDPATHQYPSYYGLPELRRAVADHYRRRFGVDLDPDTEVQPLIGSKEGLAHLAMAFIDPGDESLVPDPGYPVFAIGTMLAGGTAVPLPARPETGFKPDLEALRPGPRTRMLWLNYPSNPTAAVTDLSYLGNAVSFAREHGLLLCHDAAYSEITFDGYVAPSVLQVPGAKDVAVEFGSVSKTYNMTGWRVGWAVGNPEAIRALATIKTNLDSGIFNAVQIAAIAALEGPQAHVEEMRAIYQKRRDVVVSSFVDAGLEVDPPLGSIYVWLPTPGGQPSVAFTDHILDETGVVVSPGTGYGANGEGWFRVSLTVADGRLEEAMARVRRRLG